MPPAFHRRGQGWHAEGLGDVVQPWKWRGSGGVDRGTALLKTGLDTPKLHAESHVYTCVLGS